MKFEIKVSGVEVKSNQVVGVVQSLFGAEPVVNPKDEFKIDGIEIKQEYAPEEVAAIWDGAVGALDLLGDVVIEKIDKVTDPRRLGQYVQAIERMNAAGRRDEIAEAAHKLKLHEMFKAEKKESQAERRAEHKAKMKSRVEQREARMQSRTEAGAK